jgi:ferric-dicitrate binding protein FerR (iron transport regulator)
MSLDRFELLFERYSDGDLSGAERDEFVSLMETPEGRARFVELSSYEAALTEELRVPAAPEKSPSSRTHPKVGSRRISLVQEPEQEESQLLTRIALIAAAAVVGILTIVFALSAKPPAPPPLVNRPVLIPKLPEARSPEPTKEERPMPATTPEAKAPSDPLVVPAPRPTPRETPPPVTIEPVVPAPRSAPPPAAVPKTEVKPQESATFVATIEQVSGDARLAEKAGEVGKGVAAGQSIATGHDGYMAVRYPDGSRVELGPDTQVSKVSDGPAGKAGFLDSGMIFVDAAKQPAGRPMVLTTAQADATVIGTQFVLAANAGVTRLDVREGRVKLTRLPQGVSSVIVTAGHYAVAGGTAELTSRTGVSLWKAPMAGLQLWLKADTGVKLNGSAAAAWQDQSPAGNSAVQDRPGAQPLLIANALGGRPALRFDGLDDYLALPDGFSDFRLGLTAFVVVRPSAGGAWTRFLDLDIGPACDNIVFGRKESPDKLAFWVYANSQTKGKVEAPGAIVPDQLQTFAARLDLNGHVTLYRNGAALATGDTTVPKSTPRKPNGIAKSNSGDPFFKGDLFELLLYNRALTEAERAYVESYLNAKYLDPATPPPTLRGTDK